MSDNEEEKSINIIPAFEYADDFDEITKLDVIDDAFLSRMDTLQALLVERGNFDKEIADLALCGLTSDKSLLKRLNEGADIVLEASEEVAEWARNELSLLRKLETEARNERDKNIIRTKSEAPVLGGAAISRLELSDLAITILTTVQEPGEQLVLLLVELLNVDRYRRSNAENNDPTFKVAAQILAQDPNKKASELAVMLKKDKATIYRWKKMPEFDEKIKMYHSIFSGEMDKKMLKIAKKNKEEKT